MPKSRRSSSSRSSSSRARNNFDKPTKPASLVDLGLPYALTEFLARSFAHTDLHPAMASLRDAAANDAGVDDTPAVGALRDAAGHDVDIDYGRAISAVHDLAGWAFDVALQDVRGWREAERRVRNAQRFVLSRICGKRARRVPFEDVIFTAGLLVRIFDDDLSLGMSEMVSIFDVLGLPTEVVPLLPRNASAASALTSAPSPHSPLAPIAALRPHAATTTDPSESETRCRECGHVHAPLWPHLRNAA